MSYLDLSRMKFYRYKDKYISNRILKDGKSFQAVITKDTYFMLVIKNLTDKSEELVGSYDTLSLAKKSASIILNKGDRVKVYTFRKKLFIREG